MTTPTLDPAAVLARVPCPKCGHIIKSHYEGCNESGCCCPTGFGDIAAAHIAALEARVAGDEALLEAARRVMCFECRHALTDHRDAGCVGDDGDGGHCQCKEQP